VLLFTVRNPLPPGVAGTGRDGMGLALDNIRERLALLYGAAASVTAGRSGDEFAVQLRLPVTTADPQVAA
jgi:two-component system sensor histidine kinase AlgZ